jgi:hypothetical protein
MIYHQFGENSPMAEPIGPDPVLTSRRGPELPYARCAILCGAFYLPRVARALARHYVAGEYPVRTSYRA